jgi:hypothetical protein
MDKAMFRSFKVSMFQSEASTRSASATLVLVALGLLALYAGPKSLFILVPTALLIWYGISPVPRNGGN